MSLDLATCPPEQKQLIDQGYCGAKTRNQMAKGPFCTQPAGHRTDHRGEGRCWLHGGNNRVKSGRYSGIKREGIRELIAEHEEDPDPFNTGPEIAAVRALLQDYISRYDEWSAALIAWHESYMPGMPHAQAMNNLGRLLANYESEYTKIELEGDQAYQACRRWYVAFQNANPKPIQILDLSDAVRHLDVVTKMVERVGKLNAQNAVSRRDFVRIMTEIGNIIDTTIEDDRTKRLIKTRMSTLRLA